MRGLPLPWLSVGIASLRKSVRVFLLFFFVWLCKSEGSAIFSIAINQQFYTSIRGVASEDHSYAGTAGVVCFWIAEISCLVFSVGGARHFYIAYSIRALGRASRIDVLREKFKCIRRF